VSEWNPSLLLRVLLWPLSVVYSVVARARALCYAKGWLTVNRLSAPVISVGNLTVGGTGKTPVVIWLAEKFVASGKRVAILSRGYRGSGGTSDEIELMKHRLGAQVLFGVGKNRFAEGKPLESQGVDIFILDDGFQHMQLARDFDIVLIDASRPIDEEFLLPAGRLREPRSALKRAGAVVLSRVENRAGKRKANGTLASLPVFIASTRLLGFRALAEDSALRSAAEIGRGPFFAFCGIGNPEAFVHDLERWKIPVVGSMFFGDHHHYALKDVLAVEQAAKLLGAAVLITTEKDAQNLAGLEFRGVAKVLVAVIALDFPDEGGFLAAIDQALVAHARAAA
jgi:tetraacyldisaccharide 4'-kinase